MEVLSVIKITYSSRNDLPVGDSSNKQLNLKLNATAISQWRGLAISICEIPIMKIYPVHTDSNFSQ